MTQPIGIFDSGLGGLTVVREFLKRAPGAHLIYLGDTARVPYGTKSSQTVIRFAQEDVDFLLAFDVRGIVVACNTASSLALSSLLARNTIPILGVLEPGVEKALEMTVNKKVGVIGTPSTIASRAYEEALMQRDATVRVFSRSCPLFVPLVEEGWLEDSITLAVAHRYLDGFVSEGVDVLILGCTHYPLLEDAIGEVVGDGVTLINSAQAVAQKMEALWGTEAISQGSSLRDGNIPDGLDLSHCRFFVSDEPTRFQQVGERFLGSPINSVEQIDLDRFVGDRSA